MSETLASALGVESLVTTIEKKEQPKGDAAVLRSNALNTEVDPFEGLYETELKDDDVKIIKPPFNPLQLFRLVQQNNTLGQCVAAMEVNIDGTGFEIIREDNKIIENDPKAENLKSFFDEPYPDMSMTSLRRLLRRDLESCGNAYLEVLRNQKGEITVLCRLDPKVTRLVRLGDPTVVEKSILRGGKEEKIRISVRERRYAQTVGQKVVYFKEYGSSQLLDKRTGKFNDSVESDFEGTEVIHLTIDIDVNTPYGVPRWINNSPSVLGSRKAEEFNLEFFDHGGLPPALVMIQGGQLSKESRTDLTAYLSGKAKFKQRAIMVEAFGTGGSLDSAGNVKIAIERFGAERQNDSMFEGYDERCSQRVRGAFRIPPMFLGLAQEYNFATAMTSYMVAEAQVFQPERTEFDDLINVKIMKEVAPEYQFRSLPLSVKDVETQLRAIRVIKETVEPESVVDAVNELANLNLEYKEIVEPEMEGLPGQAPPKTQSDPKQKPSEAKKPKGEPDQLDGSAREKVYDRNGLKKTEGAVIANMDDELLQDLADDWVDYLRGESETTLEAAQVMKSVVGLLAPSVKTLFDSYVGLRVASPKIDPEGVSELIAVAAECNYDHSS